MHAAAEIDQPARPADQSGEQVRRDDVDRQDRRAAVDARVVDHRVEGAQLVDPCGHVPRPPRVGQASGDRRGAAVDHALAREAAGVLSVVAAQDASSVRACAVGEPGSAA